MEGMSTSMKLNWCVSEERLKRISSTQQSGESMYNRILDRRPILRYCIWNFIWIVPTRRGDLVGLFSIVQFMKICDDMRGMNVFVVHRCTQPLLNLMVGLWVLTCLTVATWHTVSSLRKKRFQLLRSSSNRCHTKSILNQVLSIMTCWPKLQCCLSRS